MVFHQPLCIKNKIVICQFDSWYFGNYVFKEIFPSSLKLLLLLFINMWWGTSPRRGSSHVPPPLPLSPAGGRQRWVRDQTDMPCRECGYKVYLVDYGGEREWEKRGGGRGISYSSEEGQREQLLCSF